MKKLSIASTFVLMMVAGSGVAEAKKERCKVYVDGEYELVARTHTDGGCALEAKKRVGPKLCSNGAKKFDFKYMFDGKISEGTGWCSNVK